MTDNEKAATFIGWKSETSCWVGEGGRSTAAFFDARPDGVCDCGWTFEHPEAGQISSTVPSHLEPPPDMSDPRNYMKAQVAWSILTHRESWTATPLNSISPRGYGKTPVAALAALYDAVHQS